MSNIKWIEDKTQNFRGNFMNMCFKLDNSNYIFAFKSYMSYKTFKPLSRKIAQKFNAKIVEIMKDNNKSNMIINCIGSEINYIKFFTEIPVTEGQKRQFKYYDVEEIFNNYKEVREWKTYKVDYADDNFEIIHAETNNEAIEEAFKYEKEHGIVFNVFIIDENYNEIEAVY